MAKELYLYSGIYDFTAESLISSIEEAKDEDITIRINSPGGSVFAGWGIASKMSEHKGVVNVKVDGIAASMSGVILLFADNVEVNDVTKIMLHKASMPVSSDEDRDFLRSINDQVKAKLKSKIDSSKLNEIKGITVDKLFSEGERVDLWLTAKEAKSIGLVDKIVKLTVSEAKALDNKLYNVAASTENITKENKTEKPIKMDFKQLKAEHPELYAQAVAEGVSQERARVEAWAEWMEIDSEGAKAGIDSGKAMTMKDVSAFSKKMNAASTLASIEAESEKTPSASTNPVENEEPTAAEKLQAELNAKLGLNKKEA